MKGGIKKLKTVCSRLDKANEDFPVIVQGVYLFGSLLTDKAEPRDIDLLCDFKSLLISPEEAYRQVMRRKYPSVAARTKMGGRMKEVEIIMRVLDESADGWFRRKFYNTPCLMSVSGNWD